MWKKVGELAALDAKFAPYVEAREAVKSQLEDLAFFLRAYSQNIDASPARLQEIEDRLALLERLKKKHGPALADVIAKAADLRRELHDIEHATERAAELDAELATAAAGYTRVAGALSTKRRAAAKEFCEGAGEGARRPRDGQDPLRGPVRGRRWRGGAGRSGAWTRPSSTSRPTRART